MIWWILPAAVGFFGLTVLLTGLARLGKLKLATGGARCLGGGGILALAGVMSLIGLNLQTYSRMDREETVATIEIAQQGEESFLLNVAFADEDEPRQYEVFGDQFMVEGKVIKWKSWANMLGADGVYRLDRLTGRYSTIAEEESKPRSLHTLADIGRGIDLAALIRKRGGWLKAVDASYGSATFYPMVDGGRYEVRMTQDALITRPSNSVAGEAGKAWISNEDVTGDSE